MIAPRIIGVAVGLLVTWMIFFGAGYFGGVWTHYFSGEAPPPRTGEVSVKVIKEPVPHVGPSCDKEHPCPQGPHD